MSLEDQVHLWDSWAARKAHAVLSLKAEQWEGGGENVAVRAVGGGGRELRPLRRDVLSVTRECAATTCMSPRSFASPSLLLRRP